MFARKRKAQSVLEYIIVLTAVVAGFILAKQTIQDNAEKSLKDVSQASADLISQIKFTK